MGNAISAYQNPGQSKKHLAALTNYCKVFNKAKLNVVLFDMKCENKNKIIYVLLYACSSDQITDVIDDIMKREKQKSMPQKTLFKNLTTKIFKKK